MVWLSLSARVLINVEALNMVESVGNYTRHRRAPMVVYDEKSKTFTVKFVPAISGEAIAHAYQVHLVEFAKKLGLPVCDRCEKGEFVKRSVEEHKPKGLTSSGSKGSLNPQDYAHEFEKAVIRECVVEDIAGFLHTGTVPVKRTSCVQFGYIIPALENITAVALEPEFHVRYTLTAARREQMIYYVEVGSAIYVISAAIDLSRIGFTSMIKRELVVSREEKLRRVEAALNALYVTVGQGAFGAKLSRFLPDYQVLSMVVAVSRDIPFNVKSGHRRTYIKDTARSAEIFARMTGSEVKLVAYASNFDREKNKVEVPDNITTANTVDEVFEIVKETILKGYADLLTR